MLATQTCYPQVLSGHLSPETVYWILFYITLTTDAYTGKYIPSFMIKIMSPAVTLRIGIERYVLVMYMPKVPCRKCHAKSYRARMTVLA